MKLLYFIFVSLVATYCLILHQPLYACAAYLASIGLSVAVREK